ILPDYRMVILGIPTPDIRSELGTKIPAGTLCYRLNRMTEMVDSEEKGSPKEQTVEFHTEGIFSVLNELRWKEDAEKGYRTIKGLPRNHIDRMYRRELLNAALKDLRRGGDELVYEGNLERKLIKSSRLIIERLLN
ncbi:MAG TPA: hypothetical protein VKE88_03650, partial [Candidatus Nanoarchaeia archaeon]|nr:hypothetical protein [Candidatus Nanoarchaeia archaeon]